MRRNLEHHHTYTDTPHSCIHRTHWWRQSIMIAPFGMALNGSPTLVDTLVGFHSRFTFVVNNNNKAVFAV